MSGLIARSAAWTAKKTAKAECFHMVVYKCMPLLCQVINPLMRHMQVHDLLSSCARQSEAQLDDNGYTTVLPLCTHGTHEHPANKLITRWP